MQEDELRQAAPVSPEFEGPWPGDRTESLYWVARGAVSLPKPQTRAELTVVVDRHYQLFVNGRFVLEHRGFFNGDELLPAQKWDAHVLRFLRTGENTIEFVIRSDPWRNKNCRCFRPMLMLAGHVRCGDRRVDVLTDASWRVSVVEGWREQIAMCGCGTISFERIVVPPADQTVLSGIPRSSISWTPANVGDREALPPVRLWKEAPVRIDVRDAPEVVDSGSCTVADSQIVFDLTSPGMRPEVERPVVLEACFNDIGGGEIALACPAMARLRVELNGSAIGTRDDMPGEHQMALPEYLTPTARGVTAPGPNTLRVTVYDLPDDEPEFCMALPQAPDSLHAATWRVAAGNAVHATTRALETAERIGAKVRVPPSHEVSTNPADGAVHVSPHADSQNRSFVTLDMGSVTQGRLSLALKTHSPGRVYVAHGFTYDDGVVDCQRMHLRAVDVLDASAGDLVYRSFDVRTFRYLDLVFEGFTAPVTVSEVRVEEPVFVDETRTEFDCSDAAVASIWRASVRTAQLCTDELFVDNPEREHAQWADSVAACSMTCYTCFGEYRKPAKALRDVAASQQPDGQIPGYVPGAWFPRTPLQCHMSLFATTFCEHFMHTGDTAFAEQTLDVILKMVEHWEAHRRGDGLLADLDTVFVDWGSHIYSYLPLMRGAQERTGALTAMNGHYLGVLKKTARLAEGLGREAAADGLKAIAGELAVAMRDKLFDEDRGLFRDGADNPSAHGNYSQPANALAVLHGAAPAGQEKAILERAWKPPSGLTIIPCNALFAWKAGEALFDCGCDDLAITWLRSRFGAMLAGGSDTLWETWEPHASHCQGAGAGVAYLFSRYLAGVYPSEPGYAAIGVDPHPGDLRHLAARVTTPLGPIAVRWRRTDEALAYTLILPEALRDKPIRAPDWLDIDVQVASDDDLSADGAI